MNDGPRLPAQDARAAAAQALARVLDAGATLDAALAGCLAGLELQQDKRFAKELCFGALRWFDRLEFLLECHLGKPLKRKDADIKSLILIGLYQLHHLSTPDHAAVAATVDSAAALNKAWAKPLVNAALRRSQREFHRLQPELNRCPTARHSHPQWLIDAIREDWPECWEATLEANNQRPPLHLRVNLLKTSREAYLDELGQAGLAAEKIDLGGAPGALRMEKPVDVSRLPGFEAGRVSVQDAGAQLAAPLLDPQPGERILDACAAPGGKTAHLRETQPALESITALDADEKRLGRLRDALDRLGLAAAIVHADACAPDSWWDRRPFDRILLDAPCSAAGVIRRHPDIKRLKSPQQLAALQDLQAKLLQANWPLLRRGGTLLYSTCSLLRVENDRVVERFLDQAPDAELETIRARWGVATSCGRQLLSCQDDTDGFYYATLRKA